MTQKVLIQERQGYKIYFDGKEKFLAEKDGAEIESAASKLSLWSKLKKVDKKLNGEVFLPELKGKIFSEIYNVFSLYHSGITRSYVATGNVRLHKFNRRAVPVSQFEAYEQSNPSRKVWVNARNALDLSKDKIKEIRELCRQDQEINDKLSKERKNFSKESNDFAVKLKKQIVDKTGGVA